MDSIYLQAGDGRVEIVPKLGGMVRQIQLDFGGEQIPILYPDSNAELSSNPWFRGRLLLPFNDRIPGGLYTYKGTEYQLEQNSAEDGSAIHGLIYDQPLEVSSRRNDCLTLSGELRNCKGYPFDLKFDFDYSISQNCFNLNIKATNIGSKYAPFAFGWHPYFQLGGPLKELAIKHDGESFVEVDSDLIPTGKILPVEGNVWDFRSGKVVGSTELDLAITAPQSGQFQLSWQGRVLTVVADSKTFPYTQFFTPPDRRSIAIEPITAATDAFNRPSLGLRQLEPNETFTARIELKSSRA